MIYGFKKGCYDKALLDAMTWKQRFALAEQDEESGKTCIFSVIHHDEIPDNKASLFWLYDTMEDQERIGYKPVDEPQKVFVLVYTAFDSEGLYTETKVFDTLEKAIAEKEVCIKNELSEENHFGDLFQYECGGDLQKFQEKYTIDRIDKRTYHMMDIHYCEYYVNLDIYEQIIR